VAGDGAVFDLGGALRDHHAAGDLALALVLWALGSRVARMTAASQAGRELAA